MRTSEFHPTQTVDRALRKLDEAVKQGSLTMRERELITEFLDERAAVKRQFSEGRYFKVSSMLRRFRELGFLAVPWDEITIQQYRRAIGDVRRKGYSDETVRDYVMLTRLFYVWLVESGVVAGNVREIGKIELPPKPEPHIEPELLMSEQDIVRMIAAADSPRDRAMISVWYECAMRANEVAGLTWDCVVFEDRTAKILVEDTKEHTRRAGYVISGLEYLIAWRNIYPGVPEGSAPVFPRKGTQEKMQYGGLAYLLHQWQDRAGLRRTPTHYMRKSRATNLVLQKTPEYVVKLMVWNNPKTTCYDAYVHATETDVRDGLLVNYGMKEPTEAQKAVTPVVCPGCRFTNAPGSRYCRNCGMPLSEDGQDVLRELRERVDAAMEIRSLRELSDAELMAELRRRAR